MEVKNPGEMKKALELWKSSLGVSNPKFTVDNMIVNVIDSRLFEIRPKKIKYFNQELFLVEDGLEPVIEL